MRKSCRRTSPIPPVFHGEAGRRVQKPGEPFVKACIRLSPTGKNSGFTLLEMLVVIAVMGLLVSLIVPAIRSSLAKTKQMKSLSNMRTITSGLLSFASDNNMHIPSHNGTPSPPTWDVQILPYLGGFKYSATYSRGPLTDGEPLSLLTVFRCPLDGRKQAPNFFPRSYGVSGVAVNPVGFPPPQPAPWSGGKPGRPVGEGIGLLEVRSLLKLVLICRLPTAWELPAVVVGEADKTAANGPDPGNPNAPDWLIFGGKTPYGFADGHVALLTPSQAMEVNPRTWTYDR